MSSARTLSINAYAGEKLGIPQGALSPGKAKWAIRNKPPEIRPFLAPTPRADQRDWKNEEVGWGLVLPTRAGRTPQQLATAEDAPEPIVDLVRSRNNAPVFRYDPTRPGYLIDYRYQAPISMASSPVGTGKGHLPRYLLIYGEPAEIPWNVQYALNASRIVGRLHLKGEGLQNYVTALKSGWAERPAKPYRTLVWATDYGAQEITTLMREAIAEPIQARYAQDDDIESARFHTASDATRAQLLASLARDSPSVVVTTSHGKTYPIDDPATLGATIGLPVDQDRAIVEADAVVAAWEPNGAVWYAHACCSAGCDSSTMFNALVQEGSDLERVLSALPSAGARVAPLPTALLSHPRPLRGFIGHVEPTFNWTIQDPRTLQTYGEPLVAAMYRELFLHSPLGFGFGEFFGRLSGVYSAYDEALLRYNRGDETADEMIAQLLVARDIRATILLGDPTVSIA